MSDVIAFDFDGTIVNTLQLTIDIYNSIASESHFQPVTDSDLSMIRSLPINQIIEYLNIKMQDIPFLANSIRKGMKERSNALLPFPGVQESILSLKEQGVTLGIVSTNSQSTICEYLDNHQLNCFDFVWTNPKVFGKSYTLKKLVKSYQNHTQKILYVGDEVRDIQAAKKAHIPIAAVTWGYNDESTLRKHQPDMVINSTQALSNILS